MKTLKKFYFTIFLSTLLATACLTTTEKESSSLEVTQTVIVIQQTQTAMAVGQLPPQTPGASSIPDSLILTLTEQAALLIFLTETQASSLPTETSLPTYTPRPTFTPKPLIPLFTAGENMFCREGPDTFFEAQYTLSEGKTVPALAKWVNNNWILVGISDPSTRTKCCWVGGEGDLTVNLSTLQVISFLPDRIECDLNP